MRQQWWLTATFALVSTTASAQTTMCMKKEYAEYKDQAASRTGRSDLAFEYCRIEITRKTAVKEAELALQYKQLRDARSAIAAQESCSAEASKIRNALEATRATKTIAFMHRNCEGDYKIGDK